MERNELIKILTVGLRSVSPYNCQPWQFKHDGDRLLIYGNKFERGFFGNFQELIFYSLGGLLENLGEGARHYGYAFTYRIDPDGSKKEVPVCEVNFTPSTSPAGGDISHVLNRYTNRKTYHPTPVPSAVMDKVRAIFAVNGRQVLDIASKRRVIDACAKLERVRISNKALNDELMENLRFEEGKDAFREGLHVNLLEVPFMEQQFLRASRNAAFRSTVTKWPFVQGMAQEAFHKLLTSSPSVLAFIDPSEKPQDLVQAWMDIQRILNLLCKEGIQSHIVASSVDMLKMPASCYNAGEAAMVADAAAIIKEDLGINAGTIHTLLRVGYADNCVLRSLRKDAASMFMS